MHGLATPVIGVESAETLLALQESEEGRGFRAIDVNLIELFELDVEIGRAEIMDFGISARGLLSKLVAWEIKDFEPLPVVFLVKWTTPRNGKECSWHNNSPRKSVPDRVGS